MPFDPNLPVTGSPNSSAEMRAQFQGLVELIQSIPVGPPGPQGETGPAGTSVAGAVVDSVSTVNPWDVASASASFDGTNVHFAFGIPRGNDGMQGPMGNNGNDGLTGPEGPMGPQGPPLTSYVVDSVSTLDPSQAATVSAGFDGTSVHFAFGIPRGFDGPQGPAGLNGNDGATGPEGPQGPPFGNFVVDATNTLDPGQPATVQTSFDGATIHFTFGIPRGFDGMPGPQGIPGNDGGQGPEGPQGPPGPQDLSGAVNPNIINLDLTASDPPTQSELQRVIDKLNELMNALRRPI